MPIVEMYEHHTLSSLYNAVNGYFKHKSECEKRDYEVARFSAGLVINFHLPMSHKMHSFRELIEFPWEKEQETQDIPEIKSKDDLKQYLMS